MPQADFYVLPAADPAVRQRFLCRLAEKIVPTGHQLYVHCTSEAEARAVDQLLWSFRDESFIPHQLATADGDAPVIIGWQDDQIPGNHVFVNLTEDLPAQVTGTERVVEIVVQVDAVLASTRRNFKHYKDAGYHINMNDMRPKR